MSGCGEGVGTRALESGLEPAVQWTQERKASSGQTAGQTEKEQRVPTPSACKFHRTRCFSTQDMEEGEAR